MLLLSAPVSRDDVEGLLLMEEEGHSDLISFQPTDSDIPSFLEDCNRVRPPFPTHLVVVVSSVTSLLIEGIPLQSRGISFAKSQFCTGTPDLQLPIWNLRS